MERLYTRSNCAIGVAARSGGFQWITSVWVVHGLYRFNRSPFSLTIDHISWTTIVRRQRGVLTPLRWFLIHRESKNKTFNCCPLLPQMLTDFRNSFTVRLSGKFATNFCFNFPPHLNYVATLTCEISMFKKSPSSRSNWSKLTCKT